MLILILFIIVSTANIYAQAFIPNLILNKNRFDFGSVKYLDQKTDKIKIKNTGDTILTITAMDPILKPFNSLLKAPLDINPGDSVSYEITFKPIRQGKDSQRVNLQSNTRLSHSIALLIDVSTSMNDNLPNNGIRKILAANNAVSAFIDDMLNTANLIDEAGIFSFGTTFVRNHPFSTNKTSLKAALPNYRYENTAFYDALMKTVDSVRKRPYQKVIIALTDGADNRSSNKFTSVINFAIANKVTIFIVGIGDRLSTRDTLEQIATKTGGEYFQGNTAQDIVDIYHKIFKSFGSNYNSYFDLVGYTPPPQFLLECDTTAKISPGDTLSFKISLRNVYFVEGTSVHYKLYLKYNRTMLLPLDSDAINKPDGTLQLSGNITENPDSVPLRTISFRALLGDSNCTDLQFVSIVWDDDYYPPFPIDQSCKLCIYSCVRDLRQIQSFVKDELIVSNQGGTPELLIKAHNEGNYRISLYNTMGTEVYSFRENLNAGNRIVDIGSQSTGAYICVLNTPTGTIVRKILIIR
jgi:uncharacterized protein YegL